MTFLHTFISENQCYNISALIIKLVSPSVSKQRQRQTRSTDHKKGAFFY